MLVVLRVGSRAGLGQLRVGAFVSKENPMLVEARKQYQMTQSGKGLKIPPRTSPANPVEAGLPSKKRPTPVPK